MLIIYLILLGYSIVTTAACAWYCYRLAGLSLTATRIYINLSYASDARLIIYLGLVVLLIIHSKWILIHASPFNLWFWIIALYLILEVVISTFAYVGIVKIFSNLTRFPDVDPTEHLAKPNFITKKI